MKVEKKPISQRLSVLSNTVVLGGEFTELNLYVGKQQRG